MLHLLGRESNTHTRAHTHTLQTWPRSKRLSSLRPTWTPNHRGVTCSDMDHHQPYDTTTTTTTAQNETPRSPSTWQCYDILWNYYGMRGTALSGSRADSGETAWLTLFSRFQALLLRWESRDTDFTSWPPVCLVMLLTASIMHKNKKKIDIFIYIYFFYYYYYFKSVHGTTV